MSSRPDTGGPVWTLPDELRMLAEMGDAATVREVLQVFQSDTEGRIGRIEAAIAAADATRTRLEAHAVKGSAGQVGAAALAGICKQIEVAALGQDLEEAARLLPELHTAFAAVRHDMAQARIA